MSRRQHGYALVEVLAAMLVTTVGLLAVASVFDGSRRLSSVAERSSVMTHRAQAEIERSRALGFAAIALDAAPATSADPGDPGSAVVSGTPPALRYDGRSAATEPLVVDAAAGRVPGAARPWSDGRLRGRVQTFVTWHADPACGVGCPAARNAKRITVVVTLDGDLRTRGPVRLSTLVTDPDAAPAGLVLDGSTNPLRDPATTCVPPGGGTPVPCTSSIGDGSGTSWFLYDTPASGDVWRPSAGDHPTHPTVAAVGTLCTVTGVGCPMPDLMGDVPTPEPSTAPTPVPDMSTDQTGSSGGGRVLRRDVACDGTPSADNTRGQFWVTPKLDAARTLTGDGGLTLFSRTTTGVAASVTLCARFFVVPGSLLDLVSLPPVALGTVSYALDAWPGVTTPVAFTFRLPGTALSVAVGRRLGVRVWVAGSSSSDVVLAYDHPLARSSLQVNVR